MSACVWIDLWAARKSGANLLLSQVCVCCHGNSRYIFWVAMGYCVCSLRAGFATACKVTVWAVLGLFNRGAGFRCFGPSDCLLGLFHAHKCSFQMGGITSDMYQPGTTRRLLRLAVRGKEEPHLEIWQSCFSRVLTHENSWKGMDRRGKKREKVQLGYRQPKNGQ